ncbi:MAG: L-seryl-tRNA(Sec) selenium transferase [Deltaproteobacteria bacterium]|nr:L-seryl-tRNA(Sec) selenium transferase [Deltaproteobacteria bacterium]
MKKHAIDDHKNTLLRNLPKIDEVMLLLEKRDVFSKTPRNIVRSVCRSVVEELRQEILKTNTERKDLHLPSAEKVADRATRILQGLHEYRLRRVVNATGVILHTNLGRAPLCKDAVERLVEIAKGYSNLEYDLVKGERGLRYDHVQKILCELSGAEDALVVNNNAAAVLLSLNTLAAGKEVIVSRGELVEIGGEFRIPEVMEKSGACLREVGTTNRTRLADYEKAIGPETGLILKVHTSNFRIVGFTEDAVLPSLVALGKTRGIPVMYDLGSGCFAELDCYGLEREPTVSDVLETGVSIITFSGDKLLGGPQAGIILGRRNVLQEIKQNPLNRALRIDKLTLAALEATMMQYFQPDRAISRLRVLKALTEPLKDVDKRAKKLLSLLRKERWEGVIMSVKKGFSMSGGGSLPTQQIPTILLSLVSKHLSPSNLEERLRYLEIPIIARIADDEVLFDLRTIEEEEFPSIKNGLRQIFSS